MKTCFNRLPQLLLLTFFLTTFFVRPTLCAPVSTKLAQDGKALLPVTTSAGASERTRKAAATLADYLSRITGGRFEETQSDGTAGIAVGTVADFPGLTPDLKFTPTETTRREDYILRSHAKGVYIIGTTDVAVEDAVWDFLYRLGYRQFFPGQNWEVIPKNPSPSIAVDDKEHPDFYMRRIWFTYGDWPENTARVANWSARNRAVAGITINSGHSYGGIYHANEAELAAHPEYCTSIDGVRQVPADVRAEQGVKFDLSNPGLRQLVVNHALRFFATNPTADSMSVDPSDGGHWGNSPEEMKLGSISDRVVTLANQVADEVNKKYPGKYIGFYAYNFHSPPPSIKVHPQVVVNVATAFIRGGYTLEQLMAGWQKQGATVGTREYFSIFSWDRDLPNIGRASNPQYMVKNIPHFYDLGSRFMIAESSDNWGPHGLSYYIASRLMWDVKEAKNVDALIDDFLEKSFGPAKAPMTEFYKQMNCIKGAQRRPLSDDYVGRLYRNLDEAYKLTDDPGIRARLGDLTLYVRYLELYLAYQASPRDDRLGALEQIVRHVYRGRASHMNHSLGIYRSRFRDNVTKAKMAPETLFNVPETDKNGNPKNPWKSSVPFSQEEISKFISDGIVDNELMDFTPVEFSNDLVPATPLKLPATPTQQQSPVRGTQDYWLWVPEGQQEIKVTVTAGLFYKNRGTAKLKLYEVTGDELNTPEEGGEGDDDDDDQDAPETPEANVLDQAEIPPDGALHEITLKTKKSGLLRLQISDRMMGCTLQLPEGQQNVVSVRQGTPYGFGRRYFQYFYVPRGTRQVGGFAGNNVKIYDSSGKLAYALTGAPTYFSIPVSAKQDGKLWRFESANSTINLLTVPPYLARSAAELLLPREVVKADTVP